MLSFSPDLDSWFDGLARAVKPGGTLIIGDIDPGSRGFARRRRSRPLLPVRELNGRPPEEARARLEALGHAEQRMEVFRGPWELGQVATEVGADAVVCSDVARKVVEEAGLPMISSSAWRPFYAGIPHNLELLAGLADTWA